VAGWRNWCFLSLPVKVGRIGPACPLWRCPDHEWQLGWDGGVDSEGPQTLEGGSPPRSEVSRKEIRGHTSKEFPALPSGAGNKLGTSTIVRTNYFGPRWSRSLEVSTFFFFALTR